MRILSKENLSINCNSQLIGLRKTPEKILQHDLFAVNVCKKFHLLLWIEYSKQMQQNENILKNDKKLLELSWRLELILNLLLFITWWDFIFVKIQQLKL